MALPYGNRVVNVHVLGSLNVDHPVRVARHPAVGETIRGDVQPLTPGGKGLNQAVAAARAGGPLGVTVYLHGTVGADDAGRWLIDVAAGHGVRVDHLELADGGRTGSARITVADDGTNTVIVDPGANLAARFDAAAVRLSVGDVVVAQLEVPALAVADVLGAAKAAGARSVLNPSPVGSGRELIPEASIVVVNQHELGQLTGHTLAARIEADAIARSASVVRTHEQTLVVTLGSDGVVAVGPSGTDAIAGIEVPVLDTTGAGDCFLGVLAASLAGGLAMADALRRANGAAARSVTMAGATGSMPDATTFD